MKKENEYALPGLFDEPPKRETGDFPMMRGVPKPPFFDTKEGGREPKKEIVKPQSETLFEEERIRCQYCQDVGVCGICERGKLEAALLPKKDKIK